MVYLSKLIPNIRSRRARKDLADPYEMHRTLSQGFGQGEAAFKAARCLFRIEEKRSEERYVLAQSLCEPCWEAVSQNETYLTQPPVIKRFEPHFSPGERCRFRLRANPTVKREGKRFALYRREEYMQWLERKIEAAGGKLLAVMASPGKQYRFRDKEGHPVALFGLQFDGTVEVVSGGRLETAVREGVGSAKAFGFGLLSLARLR